ncbi:MAG: TlpA disulfide reductase family protein [Trueperaceae bacterium]|nr:TlpA disulfide reductase family protein [Trueperaceae bacterium]
MFRADRVTPLAPAAPVRTLAFALALALSAFAAAQADAPDFGVREGQVAPDFTMLDADGAPVALSELRGTPVFLNFWASWCPPCVAELPLLDQAARDLEGELHVVLLNVGEDASVVEPFLADLDVDAPLRLRDPVEGTEAPDGVLTSRVVATAYQTYGLPTSILLDADGAIVTRISGAVSERSLPSHLTRVGIAWAP